MGQVRVGISGWRYPGWRGDFYPVGLPQRAELAHAAEHLNSVEINGSFYSLQRPSSYAAWREQTPEGFVFAVKGGRYLTHLLRLRGVETALANFCASGLLALGPRLGPILWQLPERVVFDAEVLDSFFRLLPRTTAEVAELASRHDAKVPDERALTVAEDNRPVRHALEFRSETFCTPEAIDLLREHDIACVLADTAGRWPWVDEDTSTFRYVRLHGDQELYASGYAPATLDAWAQRCRDWARTQDVFVYFDNDARGFAPHDAVSLLGRLTGVAARTASPGQTGQAGHAAAG